MKRVSVVGTTGSGKTTVASALADRLGVPHVEMDALHWEPNWTEADEAVFRSRVEQETAGEAWVVDGNYTRLGLHLVWPRADTVVWLDYPLPTILRQLLVRTLRRALTREELWSGNRESLRTAFLSRDSVLLWAAQTYRRRRQQYSTWLASPEWSHLNVVRLASPAETNAWLTRLGSEGMGAS